MKIYADTTDHKVFVVDDLLVLVWRAQVSKAGVASLYKASRDFTHPMCFLTIVHPTTPTPSAEDRKEIAEFMSKTPLLASAVVHNGSGLRQAVVVSIAIAISHVYKLPFQHKAFSRLDLALAWLSRKYPTIASLKPVLDKEAV